MNLRGQKTIAAPPAAVYETLLDESVLAAAMPGCRRLEPVGNDSYDVTLAVGVPAVKGVYDGTVRIFDRVPPSRYRMKVDLDGSVGFVIAEASVQLDESRDGTLVSYQADVQVGGTVAAVGQRVISGVANHQLDQMFKSIASHVEEDGAVQRGPLRRLAAKLRVLLRRFGRGSTP